MRSVDRLISCPLMLSPSGIPILVTGAHRSGSTFVGKMLAAHHSVGYLHEPFNPEFGIETVPGWFYYVQDGMESEPAFRASFQALLNGRGRYKVPVRDVPSGQWSRRAARRVIRSRSELDYAKAIIDPRVRRFLIKDPIACMSTEYLVNRYAMAAVLLFRHPAAFVASLKRMGWHFNFEDLTAQSELMDDHLAPFLEGVDQSSLSPVEQGAIVWNCVYATLHSFADRDRQLITVRHEDLSADPIATFGALYEQLGLEFTRRCVRTIETHTSDKNPTDPQLGQTDSLRRNSRENISRWKSVLSPTEIRTIHAITESTASRYYPDGDW